ncbi:MAG: hypothetical protein ABIH72_00030 [archaeon]
MLKWLFGGKKEVEEIKNDVKKSFHTIKNDMDTVSNWIKHLNSSDEKLDFKISDINERLSSIEDEFQGMKNALAFLEGGFSKRLFKQRQTAVRKQTAVEGVQIPIQTAVQTGDSVDLSVLSVMERALVFILLNTDMKLSYDDLAAMLGKSRATIRGQINTIKQKSEGLIEEIMESNGKKRLYVPEEVKEKLLKKVKVSGGKNNRKRGK